MIATGLVGLLAILGIVVSVFAFASGSNSHGATAVVKREAPAASGTSAKAPTLAEAKGVAFEKFSKVDPTLPAVPPGAVKKFNVDVFQHVTQVAPDLAPTEVWSYAVNGKAYRGTAACPPMVVNQGDKVADHVRQRRHQGDGRQDAALDRLPLRRGRAEQALHRPRARQELTIRFVAKHPGVFMYHCATQPVLMHTGAGMVGMMVVKPRNLAPVDKELWMTQQEYYLGEPGKRADMAKMAAKKPDVIAFNGYANQYKDEPITVRRGERVRMYVLNAGPSNWSAFHVIGTVFDRTVVEGAAGHDSQTMNLAPSQGGWVEFTLDQEGNYPFVTHAFGDMVKGAAGILHTTRRAEGAGAGRRLGAAAGHEKAARRATST